MLLILSPPTPVPVAEAFNTNLKICMVFGADLITKYRSTFNSFEISMLELREREQNHLLSPNK
jgi:hypothetical protein